MYETGRSVPTWNAEEPFDIMKKLVKFSAVEYDTLCEEKGRHVVDSNNIIHLRPTIHGSYDMAKIAAIQGGVVMARVAFMP